MSDKIDYGDAALDEPSVCADCGYSLVSLPYFHVRRKCVKCEVTTYLAEPGENGRGVRIREGDVPVLPAAALEGDVPVLPAAALQEKISLRSTSGRFTRFGLNWMVQQLLFGGMPESNDSFNNLLDAYEAHADQVLGNSPLLDDLDLQNEEDSHEALRRVEEVKDQPEWWATIVRIHVSFVRDALEANDASAAAYHMSIVANSRSMLIVAEELADLLWHGYRTRDLRRVLAIWDANRTNADEEFWQRLFSEHAMVLSQVFSFPVILLQGKAYVGGKGIEDTGGGKLDFLVGNELSGNVTLIEIKTPAAKLLASEYRSGVYPPSSELSGAVVQVETYKDSLSKEYYELVRRSKVNFSAFNPQCMVIAGSIHDHILDEDQQRSFELFRQGLRGVQVITFDELFAKVNALATLLEGSLDA